MNSWRLGISRPGQGTGWLHVSWQVCLPRGLACIYSGTLSASKTGCSSFSVVGSIHMLAIPNLRQVEIALYGYKARSALDFKVLPINSTTEGYCVNGWGRHLEILWSLFPYCNSKFVSSWRTVSHWTWVQGAIARYLRIVNDEYFEQERLLKRTSRSIWIFRPRIGTVMVRTSSSGCICIIRLSCSIILQPYLDGSVCGSWGSSGYPMASAWGSSTTAPPWSDVPGSITRTISQAIPQMIPGCPAVCMAYIFIANPRMMIVKSLLHCLLWINHL